MNTLQQITKSINNTQEPPSLLFCSELFADYNIKFGYQSHCHSLLEQWIAFFKYLQAKKVKFALVSAHSKEDVDSLLVKTGLHLFFDFSNCFPADKKEEEVTNNYFAKNNISDRLKNYDVITDFSFAAAKLEQQPDKCLAVCSNGFTRLALTSLNMKVL